MHCYYYLLFYNIDKANLFFVIVTLPKSPKIFTKGPVYDSKQSDVTPICYKNDKFLKTLNKVTYCFSIKPMLKILYFYIRLRFYSCLIF